MPPELAYTVRFPEAATHRVTVELRVPTANAAGRPREHLELMLPVWTPGSYLVREHSRQVETLAATTIDDDPLPVDKSRKNRWRVTTRGAAEVVVRYRLYAAEMSVRTNFVDADFALLNGAATFLTRLDDDLPAALPHRVTLELPEGWPAAFCALPRVDDDGQDPTSGATATFLAADYDALVDAPLYAGNPDVRRFTVGGAEISLVNEGGRGAWDLARAARDLEAVVHAHAAFWGGLPFGHFLFLNLVTGGSGGLEHADSTVLMTGPWTPATPKGWRQWLGLASHELFHAWNVKRLRPAELVRPSYEAEVATRALWFVEGATSYYDDLLLRRAGLLSEARYLAGLGETAERVETLPGGELQSLADASFDTWIKFYRRDENSANHTINYYGKGALVAWLLDTRIRRATGDAHSLDDLMRLAWERFPADRGYAVEDLFSLAGELGGDEVGDWLRSTVEGTGGLDYSPALTWFGLRFVDPAADGKEREAAGRGWLGLSTETRDGRLVASEVRRGTPAFDAGVNVGDELVAIDGWRLPVRGLEDRLAGLRAGRTIELLVARREQLIRLPLTLAAEPARPWKLEADPDASDEQQARRTAWLGGG